MWIKSDEDKSVASTWGAVIHLKAGEPRQVGHDLGLLCLQAGCVEIKDHKEVEEPVVEVVEEVVVEESSELDYEAMTKVQLEEHGRTLGIELDRRKKKSALIEEIKAAE
tara:strand:+ start:356 stop:682 length:327 start_codon:yes stop_codon:yes gene_type:complete